MAQLALRKWLSSWPLLTPERKTVRVPVSVPASRFPSPNAKPSASRFPSPVSVPYYVPCRLLRETLC